MKKTLAMLLAVAFAGCSDPLTSSWVGVAKPAGVDRAHALSTPLRHVVIIVQENRSFDSLFAGYPGANAPMSGTMSTGQTVALHPVNFNTPDMSHGYGASLQDYDGGKMDGFDLGSNYSTGGPVGELAYGYLERSLVRPYWIMAERYTLADAMFADEHGPSWPAHLSIIGTTNIGANKALVDTPNNSPFDCFAPAGTQTAYIDNYRNYNWNGPYPCFTQFRTMAFTIDAAHLTWRYYTTPVTGIGSYWSPFAAISKVRNGPDWNNVVTPPPTIFTDIAKGHLANVVWVTPDVPYSDHAGGSSTMGPSWVGDIVNAIGQSRYWDDTAIVILWDEWGGWYDNAVPPQITFKGLGLRVGCLIVSPYSRHYVSHTQYQFASVQKFVEEVFNLPPLGPASAGYGDTQANSIIDSFDFTQKPRAYQLIPTQFPPSQFIKMPPSGRAPDDD